ncbi:hypothetical protein [Solicola sp. PLA-1-18]|uniref:hypothetical protein n=1 Tax=Solicola sp. PLA-1-18 TaxID=3380532 RepID=UPI003B7FAEF6
MVSQRAAYLSVGARTDVLVQGVVATTPWVEAGDGGRSVVGFELLVHRRAALELGAWTPTPPTRWQVRTFGEVARTCAELDWSAEVVVVGRSVQSFDFGATGTVPVVVAEAVCAPLLT